MKKLLTGLIIFSLFNECSVNPITKRKQLSIVSNHVIFPQSFAAYKETLEKSKISTNKLYNERVLRVGKRIQAAVEKFFNESGSPNTLANYRWEYKVIDSKKLNAWCMPGGKVAFYTGILPICANDAGVAVVMGHEIAHAIANHGAERIGQEKLLGLGGVALSLGSKPTSTSSTQKIIMQAYGIGSTIGLLKYNRKQESEADEMGILFMALAGYDPEAAPYFWERMKAISSKNGSAPPEFLSTHPSSQTRITRLNTLMPIAKQVYKSQSIDPYFEAKRLKLIQ